MSDYTMSDPLVDPHQTNMSSPSSSTNNDDDTLLIRQQQQQKEEQQRRRQHQIQNHLRIRKQNTPLDHAARVYSGFAMALVIPVTITMLIIVWTLQTLKPVDNREPSTGPSSASAPVSSSSDPIFVVNKETPDKTTGEKIGGALLNMLIVVAVITVITFIMVILYKYGYAKILYVWLGLSGALVFFFLSGIYIDLIAARFQVPYDYVMFSIFVWNFGVVGILSVFYMGHAIVTQGYLIVLSVIVAWGLSQTPEWTTWALLLGVACYDIAAVLCPNGPLKLLVEAAQERQEPIPGFVYDSEAGPAVELHERPRPKPKPAPKKTEEPKEQNPPSSSSTTTSGRTSRNNTKFPSDDDKDYKITVEDVESETDNNNNKSNKQQAATSSNPLDDILGTNPNSNNNTNNKQAASSEVPYGTTGVTSVKEANASSTSEAPKPGAKPAPNKPQPKESAKKKQEEEDDEDPFEAAHSASAFKLGLGDFIFYSLLVGRAAMTFEGTQTPWLICYICIICGMGGTLASLLFLRGTVPALPALPFSVVAAAAAFFITRYLTLPYWDFMTLYAFTP